MRRKRVGVLISGRGSNMRALVEAARNPSYPAEIVNVVSNIADAPGLAWAKEQGISTAVISHKDYRSREAFDAVSPAIARIPSWLQSEGVHVARAASSSGSSYMTRLLL